MKHARRRANALLLGLLATVGVLTDPASDAQAAYYYGAQSVKVFSRGSRQCTLRVALEQYQQTRWVRAWGAFDCDHVGVIVGLQLWSTQSRQWVGFFNQVSQPPAPMVGTGWVPTAWKYLTPGENVPTLPGTYVRAAVLLGDGTLFVNTDYIYVP